MARKRAPSRLGKWTSGRAGVKRPGWLEGYWRVGTQTPKGLRAREALGRCESCILGALSPTALTELGFDPNPLREGHQCQVFSCCSLREGCKPTRDLWYLG